MPPTACPSPTPTDWEYVLYTRSNCQLCQQAEELLQQHWHSSAWLSTLQVVDLADTQLSSADKAALIAKYGHEVPLLLRCCRQTGREQWLMRWHFTSRALSLLKVRLVREARVEQKRPA